MDAKRARPYRRRLRAIGWLAGAVIRGQWQPLAGDFRNRARLARLRASALPIHVVGTIDERSLALSSLRARRVFI